MGAAAALEAARREPSPGAGTLGAAGGEAAGAAGPARLLCAGAAPAASTAGAAAETLRLLHQEDVPRKAAFIWLCSCARAGVCSLRSLFLTTVL